MLQGKRARRYRGPLQARVLSAHYNINQTPSPIHRPSHTTQRVCVRCEMNNNKTADTEFRYKVWTLWFHVSLFKCFLFFGVPMTWLISIHTVWHKLAFTAFSDYLSAGAQRSSMLGYKRVQVQATITFKENNQIQVNISSLIFQALKSPHVSSSIKVGHTGLCRCCWLDQTQWVKNGLGVFTLHHSPASDRCWNRPVALPKSIRG